MVAFPNVAQGDILIDERRVRLMDGSRRLIKYVIEVLSIDHTTSMALVRVDGGIPRTVTARFFASLRRATEKETVG